MVGASGGPGQAVTWNNTQQWIATIILLNAEMRHFSYATTANHADDLLWHSPKHGSVTSASVTLPVPALQVHMLGVPPAEVLLVGQAAHTPEVG